MFTGPDKKAKSECPICYLAHDDEIHEATLRIHRWFSRQVTQSFADDSLVAVEPQSEQVAS